MIRHHLNLARTKKPKQVEKIELSLHVDDILSSGQTVEEVKELKNGTTEIFDAASLKLHKWNSNLKSLEEESPDQKESLSHAKKKFGVKGGETTLLGLKWKIEKDTIGVTFPKNESASTKRGIPGKVAKIYYPLGLVLPITLGGKLLYRQACDEKRPWDAVLSKIWSRNGRDGKGSFRVSWKYRERYPKVKSQLMKSHFTVLETRVRWLFNPRRRIKDL